MPCCCVRVLNLCAVPVCGDLTINSAPPADDKFALVLDFLETTITIKSDNYSTNTFFTFPISMLNENFEYTGKILDSAGAEVPIVIGEETYDCVKFKTKVNVEYVFT